MPRLRRFVAALLGVLLLQLTLQESAWACVRTTAARPASATHTAAMAHEHGMPTHRGADAPGVQGLPGVGVDATVAVPAPAGSDESPCCTPDAMHGSCGTAGVATVAAVVAGVGALTDHAPVRWPRVAHVPASLGAAPDVPPPKA